MGDNGRDGPGHLGIPTPNGPPMPVPELGATVGPEGGPSPDADPGPVVTDEDRTRFGLLLDHAAERGLLGPADYQVRLRELAEATSIEEMTAIVSELPAFQPAPATVGKGRVRPAGAGPGRLGETGSAAGVAAPLGAGPASTRRRSSPWVLLVLMVVVVAASLLFLALYAEHTVHGRTGTGQPAPTTLSVPRP